MYTLRCIGIATKDFLKLFVGLVLVRFWPRNTSFKSSKKIRNNVLPKIGLFQVLISPSEPRIQDILSLSNIRASMVTTGLHPTSNIYHLRKVLSNVSESVSDAPGN
jgi:hypothetical protein